MKPLRKHIFSLFAILFLMTDIAHAQRPKVNIKELLTKKMNQFRNSGIDTIDKSTFISADPDIILRELETFENDVSPQVRDFAYGIANRVGIKNLNISVRQKVTEHLLKGCSDLAPLVWQNASKNLLSFNSNDFSEDTKKMIRVLLSKEKSRLLTHKMILVAGVANMLTEKNQFEKLLIDESKYESKPHAGRWYGTVGWAARIALARMGSKKDIEHAINMVKSEKEPITRVTRLLRDLAYIRQPEVVNVLSIYLNSEEKLPSTRPGTPGTKYCQYALDILAQILDGFPVKNEGPGGYSQAEIDLCRQWMKEQREWKVKNPAPRGGVLY